MVAEVPEHVRETGNVEFLILSDLRRLAHQFGPDFFPADEPGTPGAVLMDRRWAEIKPDLRQLALRLVALVAEGRL